MYNKPEKTVVIGSRTAENLVVKRLMAIKKTDSVFVVLPYNGEGDQFFCSIRGFF